MDQIKIGRFIDECRKKRILLKCNRQRKVISKE